MVTLLTYVWEEHKLQVLEMKCWGKYLYLIRMKWAV